MPTYYALVNVRYPANGLECHGQFTNEAEARQLIEKELTDLYGDTWERLNSIQYDMKNDMSSSFVLALLDIRYSTEEKERRELDRLPGQIAELQMRLEALQKMYPPVLPAPEPPEPPRPIKLRRKFDSKLRRAIRDWNSGTLDYECTMDDLNAVVDDDEWKVIVTVFDRLEAEFKKHGGFSDKRAWELAEEARAKLAQDGAL